MTDNPDQIREEIERTREELGHDVDKLADKVSPSSIIHRRTERVKASLGRAKDRFIGSADDAKHAAGSATSTIGDAASAVGHSVADAPHAVARKTEGNPVAVGLIAFGVGLLAAAAIPASSREKQLANDVKDRIEPLQSGLTDVAKEVAGNLREPATQAAEAIKGTATAAFADVKDEATISVDDVKQTATSGSTTSSY